MKNISNSTLSSETLRYIIIKHKYCRHYAVVLLQKAGEYDKIYTNKLEIYDNRTDTHTTKMQLLS